MFQSERVRTVSMGALTTRKTRKITKSAGRYRSYSTDNQQKIDELFVRDPKNSK